MGSNSLSKNTIPRLVVKTYNMAVINVVKYFLRVDWTKLGNEFCGYKSVFQLISELSTLDGAAQLNY